MKKPGIRIGILSSVFCLLDATQPALANVGNTYGFGAQSAALAGVGAPLSSDPYAAYKNPASLPFSTQDGRRFSFAYGLKYLHPSFTSIEGVVTENTVTSDQVTTGNVDTSYRSTFGQELAFVWNFAPERSNFSLGVVSFLPLEQLAYIDTGESFIPEYFLYRASTQRPQIELGLGGDLSKHIHLGAGLHFAFSLTSSANVFLQSQSNTSSTMRFTASMKPKLSPYLGVLITPTEDPEELSIGTVVRFASTSDNSMTLNSSARVFGTLAALDFNFKANSALFYDPLTFELGTSWQHSPAARLYLQIDYQLWSNYKAPALDIQNPSVTSCPDSNCGLAVTPGNLPDFQYRNVLIPRIAEEIRLEPITLRAGYAYRRGIVTNDLTGNGNYLDPDKHWIAAGLGWEFRRFLGHDVSASLDFNVTYQALVTQHIEKSPKNQTSIGAPGYQAGGNIFGGGVSLSLAL